MPFLDEPLKYRYLLNKGHFTQDGHDMALSGPNFWALKTWPGCSQVSSYLNPNSEKSLKNVAFAMLTWRQISSGVRGD